MKMLEHRPKIQKGYPFLAPAWLTTAKNAKEAGTRHSFPFLAVPSEMDQSYRSASQVHVGGIVLMTEHPDEI